MIDYNEAIKNLGIFTDESHLKCKLYNPDDYKVESFRQVCDFIKYQQQILDFLKEINSECIEFCKEVIRAYPAVKVNAITEFKEELLNKSHIFAFDGEERKIITTERIELIAKQMEDKYNV